MDKKHDESSNVEDVRREELSRCGGRSASNASRRRQEPMRDTDDFVGAMGALGLKADSSGWDKLIRIWREYRP